MSFHLELGRCKSCDASIIWAVHAGTGRSAPIDAEPSDGGNIMLRTAPGDRHHDGAIVYTLMTKEAAETYHGGDAHRNHFATCPDAASHR